MAKIKIQKDYNYWLILLNAGIDAVLDTEKYSFNEKTLELEAACTQEVLNNALANYDHEAWLREMNKPQPLSETEQIRLEMARSNAEMFETMISLLGGI